jgi:type III pantothenate kinase
MIIAVDLGNTRAKWAAHPGDLPVAGRFVADGSVDIGAVGSLAETWGASGPAAGIIACSVAGSSAGAALAQVAQRLSVPLRQVVPGSECAGVRNLYEQPGQLGADRWAALVGARARTAAASLVVDAGTAMTVDAIAADGRFLGGLIVAGYDLMRSALARGTARLPLEEGRFMPFPRSTRDAIVSGALQALAGAVARTREAMIADGHGAPQLLLTGGAAAKLAPLLAGWAPVFAPQLVLEGTVAVAIDGRFGAGSGG